MAECIVCCLAYNAGSRKPWDLGCGHCVCETCLLAGGTSPRLKLCAECRQPATNPHMQWTLLRMLHQHAPTSPTSFPIGGCLADDSGDDGAPGTPQPSAPAMEAAEHWEPHGAAWSHGARGASPRSSGGGDGAHRLSLCSAPQRELDARQQQQQQQQQRHAPGLGGGPSWGISSSSGGGGNSSRGGGGAASRSPSPLGQLGGGDSTSSISASSSGGGASAGGSAAPVHALGRAVGGVSSRLSRGGAGACGGELHARVLASFPVDDDLQDDDDTLPPDSPHSGSAGSPEAASGAASAEPAGADGGGGEGEGEGGGEGHQPAGDGPGNGALAGLQAALAGCGALLQQLVPPPAPPPPPARPGQAAPPAGFGWPPPGPSLLLALSAAAARAWSAYGSALAAELDGAQALRRRLVSELGQLIAARLGVARCGPLAYSCLSTWVLGSLLLRWQLALQLLPLAASALGLRCSAGMRASSGGCSLWPAKAAGGLVCGQCLLLAALGCAWQQLGMAAGLHGRLLAATPRVLLLAALLLAGQAVQEVLSRGWSSYAELRFASLALRSWAVAAGGVLLGARAAAVVPWVQKAQLLLEGPMLVNQLGLLLQPAGARWPPPAERGRGGGSISSNSGRGGGGGAAAAADAAAATATGLAAAASGPVAAWLLCVHCLLQLLLLLYVPPAPLATATWLPTAARGALVWAAHVLACGCAVQLALQQLPLPAGACASADQAPPGAAAAARPGLPPPAAVAGPSSSSAGGKHGAEHCGGGGLALVQLRSRCCSPEPDCYSADADRQRAAALDGAWQPAQWPAPRGGAAGPTAAAAAAAALLRQHALYLGLLLAAAAGDTFIAAVPGADAVRLAWQGCLRSALAAAFAAEAGAALWAERRLLRRRRRAASPRGW